MRLRVKKEPDDYALDLTSLVDVAFLLVVFFTLTTQFVQAMQRTIDLPRQPGDRANYEPDKALVIEVERDGTIFAVGSGVLTVQGLADLARVELGRARQAGRGLDLILRVDRLAPSAHLNKIAGALAVAGVSSWRLATSGDQAESARAGPVGGRARAQGGRP
ncbi:MAG: hypothetical protein C0468_03070 [Planctomyces sp.]|nr:hypothetical protein [Planctomyces sp.]MBA4119726.1 hypothetical protein [Isosphaera sp.]